jgi:hypothetical protein
MSRVIVSRVIPAPPGTVWAIFSDLTGRVSWLSDVDSVELLTPGPLAPGTRWRETRVDATGTAVAGELVITDIEDSRSMTMALVGTSELSHVTYVFAPVDVGHHRGGTTVTAIVESRPHGLANRLLSFLLGNFAARTAEGHLRDELGELSAAALARGSGGPTPAGDRPETTAA